MATYVNDLRLKEIGTGESSGTWGTETNTNLELIGEALGYGTEGITTNADTHTTTVADGSTDPGRAMYIKYTGTLDSACTITIAPNTLCRMHFIENATSGSQNIIISQGSGANVTIPAGDVKAVYLDGAGSGAAVVDAFASLSTVDLKVQDDLTVTDDVTIGGDLDVDGTTNLDAVDIDGATQADGTITVGVNDTGYDVKFFGATSGAYMLWDESADDLKLVGAAGLTVAGDVDVDGTTNLDAVDIDGAVQADNTITVGVDDTGYDVKFFGATSGRYLLWDESNDSLDLMDSVYLRLGTGGDFNLYHDGSHSYIYNNLSDSDIVFKGNDGSSTITALTLDMSAAGHAQFNAGASFAVTPHHEWESNYIGIEIGSSGFVYNRTSGNELFLSGNAYYDSGWKYGADGRAAMMDLQGGRIRIRTSNASGSQDGAITWVTAFDLTADTGAATFAGNLSVTGAADTTGNLTVGANDDEEALLTIRYSTVPGYISSTYDGSDAITAFSQNQYNTDDGSASVSSVTNSSYAAAAIKLYGNTGDSSIRFYTATAANTTPTEYMRVDHQGYVGINVTDPDTHLEVSGNIHQSGAGVIRQGQSDGTPRYINIPYSDAASGFAFNWDDLATYATVGDQTAESNSFIFEVNVTSYLFRYIKALVIVDTNADNSVSVVTLHNSSITLAASIPTDSETITLTLSGLWSNAVNYMGRITTF